MMMIGEKKVSVILKLFFSIISLSETARLQFLSKNRWWSESLWKTDKWIESIFRVQDVDYSVSWVNWLISQETEGRIDEIIIILIIIRKRMMEKSAILNFFFNWKMAIWLLSMALNVEASFNDRTNFFLYI